MLQVHWYRTVTAYNSTTAKQIQAKFNSTAGPQAITKSMGLLSVAVMVESPPQGHS